MTELEKNGSDRYATLAQTNATGAESSGALPPKHKDTEKIGYIDYVRIKPIKEPDQNSIIKNEIFHGGAKWEAELEKWKCYSCNCDCDKEEQRSMVDHIRPNRKERRGMWG